MRGASGADRAWAQSTYQQFSAFDRKNYFYPDLPQGYQISQLYHPIVGEGEVFVELGDGTARLVRIERIHLEQDAGKSVHDMDPNNSFRGSQPHGRRPDGDRQRAQTFAAPKRPRPIVAKLRQILRYLGTCDGNMQSGSLRADVNVSVCRPGALREIHRSHAEISAHLGTRCEIKNMNSMRFMQASDRLMRPNAGRSRSSEDGGAE